MPLAAPLAAGLLLAWLLLEPRTPDLAGQAYRLALYERGGLGLFDERWYAGHTLPGYSLLFGPLASLAGMRALAVASVLGSVVLFERLVLGAYGDDPRVRADRRSRRSLAAGTCLFAVAAVGDVWSGRLTFALGVTFALGSLYALARGRPLAAALLAGACTAASPVAGLLLALAALTYALTRPRRRLSRRARRGLRSSIAAAGSQVGVALRSPHRRALLAIVAPVALVALPVRALFGEGGYEPYPASSFAATVLAVGLFWWALPRGAAGEAGRHLRMLRVGALLYLIACMLCLLVHTPMGSNVERYGVLLAGPLLLCALALDGARPARAILAAGAIALWIVWGPVRETAAVAGSPATRASYYAPLARYLLAHGGRLERVEVPLTRSHWEAALLAPSVSLARGWEKQLEERYDAPLLSPALRAGAYRRWLSAQAVSYVALPDVPLDRSSAREGALIRRGLPYLREVLATAHWRVYAVRDPTPLLDGPGRLTALGSARFALDAHARGTLLARIHYTRYFTVVAGDGCVASAPGGWTYVRARAPGPIAVEARFSLGRALGLEGGCHLGALGASP